MRKIRNEFAHHVEYRSFNDSPISDYIDSMHPTEKPVFKRLGVGERSSRPTKRMKFLVRSVFAIVNLVRETTAIQAAIAHPVDLVSVFFEFDHEQENIKNLMGAAARIILNIVPHSE